MIIPEAGGRSGAVAGTQSESINQLVSQLSTGSDRSSGPSSCSTDPSVSFNFVCPVPRGSQRDSDSQTATPSVNKHGSGCSQPISAESSSQQVSLWADQRESGRAPAASRCSQGNLPRRHHSRRTLTQPTRGSASGAAWRAATSTPTRDSYTSGVYAPVITPHRGYKRTSRPCQSGRMSVHTAGSHIELPAPVTNRLHSSPHLSPVTTCSSISPQLQPSRLPPARALRAGNDRRALQPHARPRRHMAPGQRSSRKQRLV